MSAPVEFPSSPEFDAFEVFDGLQRARFKWFGTIGVNLQWIAGARMFGDDPRYTEILLAGSSHWIAVNVPYAEFMRMWTDHMEART